MNDADIHDLLELVLARTEARQAAFLSPAAAWPLLEAGLVEPVVRWGRPGHISGVVITPAGRAALEAKT